MPAAWGTCVAIGEEWLTIPRRLLPQWLGICRPPELGSSALEKTPRKISYGVMTRDQHHTEVAVVRHPDVGAGPQRRGRADLAAFVTRDGNDEGRAAHPILPERGFVDQPRRQHLALHAKQILGRESERLVWRVGHLCGHLEPPRTLRGVYTRDTTRDSRATAPFATHTP